MRVLVTGGAGFIGSHVVDLLVDEDHDVAVVDNLSSGSLRNLNVSARFFEIDVQNAEFAALLRSESPEVIFHLAAQPSVKASTDDPLHDAHVNILGLLNVLESCVAGGVRKVVFASSSAVYGNPESLPFDEAAPARTESPYGISKLMG